MCENNLKVKCFSGYKFNNKTTEYVIAKPLVW